MVFRIVPGAPSGAVYKMWATLLRKPTKPPQIKWLSTIYQHAGGRPKYKVSIRRTKSSKRCE